MEMMKTADHKYSRWKDLAWRFINGAMGTFFLIAALLQVSDIIFYPYTKNLEEFNRNLQKFITNNFMFRCMHRYSISFFCWMSQTSAHYLEGYCSLNVKALVKVLVNSPYMFN